MIRMDAVWLALGASDLRCGMDSLLGKVPPVRAGSVISNYCAKSTRRSDYPLDFLAIRR